MVLRGDGGLQSWKRLNYVPYLDYDYLGFGTNSRSISRTLEYSYNNFCLSMLAKGLGKHHNYIIYLTRSGSWQSIYKADQKSFINGKKDDSGAMGAVAVFSMMGLFPNPGQNVYLITPPFFEVVRITHPRDGRTATIRNIGFEPGKLGRKIFVRRALLNGKKYSRNWIRHESFTKGMTLELFLGYWESDWGQGEDDLPPSLGGNAVGERIEV